MTREFRTIACLTAILSCFGTLSHLKAEPAAEPSPIRSAANETYAHQLWDFVNREGKPYDSWSKFTGILPIKSDMKLPSISNIYINRLARRDINKMPPGSTAVVEHLNRRLKPSGVTVFVRKKTDSPKAEKETWYWAHYSPAGHVIQTSADLPNAHGKPGFYVEVKDRDLWIFKTGTDELTNYIENGKCEDFVIMPDGPEGLRVKAPAKDVIYQYSTAHEKFVSGIRNGRLWVFRKDAPEAANFSLGITADDHVTRIGAGPARPDRQIKRQPNDRRVPRSDVKMNENSDPSLLRIGLGLTRATPSWRVGHLLRSNV